MKNKKIKKIIAIALIAATTIEVIPTTKVFAATKETNLTINTNDINVLSEDFSTGKSNFVLLDDSLDNMEYTYDKNGNSYKAIESLSESLDEGKTEIYQKNETGDYEIVSTTLLNVSDGKIKTKTKDEKTNEVKKEEYKLKDLVETKSVTKLNKLEEDINADQPRVKRSATLLTEWQYTTSIFSSNKIKKYTMTFVIAALAGTIGYFFTTTAAAAAGISGLTAIAEAIISDEMPIVYYGEDVYSKYILGLDPPLRRAERSLTSYYTDKSRKHKIDDTVVNEYYVTGWY